MSRIEKQLCIIALVFVAIYVGAIVVTLDSRTEKTSSDVRIESPELDAAVRHVVLAEVFPPFLVLFTLTVCFVIARKKQKRARLRLDDPEEENVSEEILENSESDPHK